MEVVQDGDGMSPSVQHPLLLGIMVDVSQSMTTLMRRSADGRPRRRLEGVRTSLDALISRAAEYCATDDGAVLVPRLNIFAYGFGFGNLIARLGGWTGSNIQDLLVLPGDSPSAVPVDQLAVRWDEYRRHVAAMAKYMLGETPMLQAFHVVRDRFALECSRRAWADQPVLFVLSDGLPTDGTADQILAVAADLKTAGVLVVTCLLTDSVAGDRKHLYAAPRSDWSPASRLMHECASAIPTSSESIFRSQLQEYETYLTAKGWQIDPGARMFTQIDDPEALSEYLNLTVARLSGQETPVDDSGTAAVPEGLTEAEIAALARAYSTPASAKALLERARLDPTLLPFFNAPPSPIQFWTEIGRELELGHSVDGRGRLLAAAAAEFPANPAFENPPGPSTPARLL